MRKNQHTIYGINGSAAVLASKNYKIIDVFIQSGSPAELYKNPKNSYVTEFFGETK